MIEAAVQALILTDPEIVGAVQRRVFPVIAAQGAPLPFMVYQRIDSDHVHSFDGITGLARLRLQLDVYAESYRQVKAIAERVRLKLSGYSGVSLGVVIQGLTLLTTRDNSPPPQSAKEKPVHRVSMDFNCWYDEPKT